jgi:hypothetical protein
MSWQENINNFFCSFPIKIVLSLHTSSTCRGTTVRILVGIGQRLASLWSTIKTQSSLLMCSHNDESTTNQILTWDTWKSLPIRVERIPDATVPIGTDLDVRQACYEDGKENFRNCQIWAMEYLKRISISLSLKYTTLICWCELD